MSGFFGGLADGFGQGYRLGTDYKERKRDEEFSKGLGEVYGAEKPEDMSPQDWAVSRMEAAQPLIAEYRPNQLPTFTGQLQNTLARQAEMDRLQQEEQTQQAIRERIGQWSPESGESALELLGDVASLGGDATPFLEAAGQQGELLAQNSAYEFMSARRPEDLVSLYSRVRDGQNAEITTTQDGGQAIRVFPDNDPETTTRTIPFSNTEGLRARLVPELSRISPRIANNVYTMQAEQRQARLDSIPDMSSDDYELIQNNAMRFEDRLWQNSGMDREDAPPDVAASFRNQARTAAIDDYLQTRAAFRSGVTGSGLGGQGAGAAAADPQRVRAVLSQMGISSRQPDAAPGSNPQSTVSDDAVNNRSPFGRDGRERGGYRPE